MINIEFDFVENEKYNAIITKTIHNNESFPDVIKKTYTLDFDNKKALAQQLNIIVNG